MQNQTEAASEPIFNIPGSVLFAAALMIVVQIVKGLLPDEEALEFLLALAFIPARYDGAALELPGGYLTAVTSFVTYMIVHAGWVHLLVNLLWMIAFGSAVARRVGASRFFVFSILCGIAGALYVPQVGIINPSEMSPANSIEIAIWVAVGGRGTLTGAIIGAGAVSGAKSFFTQAFPEVWLYALGLIFILVTLFLPRGIMGLLAGRGRR